MNGIAPGMLMPKPKFVLDSNVVIDFATTTVHGISACEM
jgi:hypothetical protein